MARYNVLYFCTACRRIHPKHRVADMNWPKNTHLQVYKKYFCKPATSKGQAVVEFTLVFVLLLAISWIPADFGLAIFTGQLAQNASREGARLAAATNPFNAADIQTQVSNRIRSALLTNTTVNVAAPACDPTLGMQVVSVTVSGDYNFHFYQLLRLLGLPAPNSLTMTRTTSMRYEHAFTC